MLWQIGILKKPYPWLAIVVKFKIRIRIRKWEKAQMKCSLLGTTRVRSWKQFDTDTLFRLEY